MTDNRTNHIILTFKQEATDITLCYAVSDETLRAAQVWRTQQAQTPSVRDLERWLYAQRCLLDRADGPAIIKRYADGSTREVYYRNGDYHRDNAPALVEHFADGSTREAYYSKGKCHRENGPAVIVRAADGTTRQESYWRNDKRHRDGHPAQVLRFADGSTSKAYYRDGKLHREDGPAIVEQQRDGTVIEYFYTDNKFLRKEILPPLSGIPGVMLQRTTFSLAVSSGRTGLWID